MFTVARLCALVTTVLLAGGLETSAIAQVYSVTDLGSFDTYPTAAHGLNNAGDAVGYSQWPTQAVHACLFHDGDVIDLGTLGGSHSYAEKINDAGQIVGYAGDRFQDQHAFLWQDGEMTDLGTFGGCCSRALAINAAGQVAGDSDTQGPSHAFLYTDGSMIDLGTFGGPQSHAGGIDAFGHVVGYAEFSDGRSHAFLYCEGALLDLNDLIAMDSGWELVSADAINDVGQILGVGVKEGRLLPYLFQDGDVEAQPGGAHINHWGEMVGNVRDPQIHPAVVRDGELIDLNTLIPEDSGWTLYYAEDLNDAGQIVGWGKHAPLIGDRAFLLTPTDPEWNRSMPAQRGSHNAARPVRSPAADLCPSLPVIANR